MGTRFARSPDAARPREPLADRPEPAAPVRRAPSPLTEREPAWPGASDLEHLQRAVARGSARAPQRRDPADAGVRSVGEHEPSPALVVGAADDRAEHEADRVAGQVMLALSGPGARQGREAPVRRAITASSGRPATARAGRDRGGRVSDGGFLDLGPPPAGERAAADLTAPAAAPLAGAERLGALEPAGERIRRRPAAVIRRAVAFELESSEGWKVQGRKDVTDNYALIKDTKKDLATGGNLGVQSDSGNLEFVTRPVSTLEDLTAVFRRMRDVLGELAAQARHNIHPPHETELLDWVAVGGYRDYRVHTATSGKLPTDRTKWAPQATIDVPFAKFDAFLKAYASGENTRDLIGKSFADDRTYIQGEGTAMLEGLSEPLHDASKGFLEMVLMVLFGAYRFPGGDDPKYAFPVMPRNRYSEMYVKANEQSGSNLAAVFPEFVKKVNAFRKVVGLPDLYPKGYKGDDGREDGPTVAAWLESITTPVAMSGALSSRASDLVSPPPGQRDKQEGLGAYDLKADGVPFFELRDFMSANSSRAPQSFDDICAQAAALLKVEEALRG